MAPVPPLRRGCKTICIWTTHTEESAGTSSAVLCALASPRPSTRPVCAGRRAAQPASVSLFFFFGVQMRHATATRHNPFSRPAHDPSPIQGRKTEYKKYYCVVDVIGGLTHYQAILKFNSNRPAPLAESLLWVAFQCNSPAAATCLRCAKCARGPQNRAEAPP